MATVYTTHGAAAVRQIDTITVADVWTAADTVTLTINSKDLVVTIGADTSTTQVATAIRDAWNANSRLDSEGATDATSNFGGQECGEYAEATASIDPDTPSVVRITANKAGVPFTLSVTENTAGTGTAAEATAQAATGPWHWDNGDNWSGGAAPSNDDVVVLKDQTGPNCGFKYGLPNATKEVTIQHWMSYTGPIGLPSINTDNPAKPYPEYRQQYVLLDDAGTGVTIAHRFGLGKDGVGSPMINLRHDTLACAVIVYNTGASQIAGRKSLNLVCTNNASTVNVLAGSVDLSSQFSGTAAVVTLAIAGGDVRCVEGLKAASSVTVSGGNALIGGTTAITTLMVNGGTCRLEGQTGTITTLSVIDGGTVDQSSTGLTVSVANIYNNGTLDARNNAGSWTLTNGTVHRGGRFLDPYRRVTMSNALKLAYDPAAELLFGANATNTISVSNA